MAGKRGELKPPPDPLSAIDATIVRLEQMDDCARILRLTAPRSMAELGDLSRRMRPTPIGFAIELTIDEWATLAAEYQVQSRQ